MGQFGDKFRKAREAKNFSLDDVSNVTKIGARMLQAIEEEHFDVLPGGVFNKGFIRAYAKHLGLNDEEAVADYLACLRQAQIDAHEVWQPEPPAQQAPSQKPPLPAYTKPAFKAHPPVQVPVQVGEELPGLQLPRAEHVRRPAQKYLDRGKGAIPWKLIVAFAVVIILAVILWIRHSRSSRAQVGSANASPVTTAPAAPPASAGTVPVASNQPAPAKPAPNGPSQSQSLVPAAASPQSTQPATHASTPPAKTPPSAGTNPAPTTKPATTPATNSGTTNEDANDVTVRTFVPSATQAKPAPTMTLVIRATETSWISVTADGQLAAQETLIAPAHASIRATREIVARIGNAAGVTFLWNGREIPAQGAEAEVKTFVFDGQGMREAPNQPPVQNH